MEGAVDETDDLAGLLADMVNMQIPGKLMNAEKFSGRYTLNLMIVESKCNIRKGVFLGGDDHKLGFGRICSKMIATEPIVDRVNVRLEVSKIRRVTDGLEKGGIISIEDQRTIQRKGSETKIINIDKKEKRSQD